MVGYIQKLFSSTVLPKKSPGYFPKAFFAWLYLNIYTLKIVVILLFGLSSPKQLPVSRPGLLMTKIYLTVFF